MCWREVVHGNLPLTPTPCSVGMKGGFCGSFPNRPSRFLSCCFHRETGGVAPPPLIVPWRESYTTPGGTYALRVASARVSGKRKHYFILLFGAFLSIPALMLSGAANISSFLQRPTRTGSRVSNREQRSRIHFPENGACICSHSSLPRLLFPRSHTQKHHS